MKVRRVKVEDISTELSLLDRAVLMANPLYKEHVTGGSNPLWVAG